MIARITGNLKKQKPTNNRWGVSCKDQFSFASLKREVIDLIAAEKTSPQPKLVGESKGSYLIVECNAAFGKKLKSLPSANPQATCKVRYYPKAKR